jgi:hypothetical protein
MLQGDRWLARRCRGIEVAIHGRLEPQYQRAALRVAAKPGMNFLDSIEVNNGCAVDARKTRRIEHRLHIT